MNSIFGFFEKIFERIVETVVPFAMKHLPVDKIVGEIASSENLTEILSPDVISNAVSSGAISQDMISGAVDSGVISADVISDAIASGYIPSDVVMGATGEITADVVADAVANGQIDASVISDALSSGNISSEMISDVVSDAVSNGSISDDLISDIVSSVTSGVDTEGLTDMITSGITEKLSGLLPAGFGTFALIGSIVFSLLFLTGIVFLFIALWKTYAKAGQPGWAVLIPFYGNFIHYRVAWGSGGFYFLSWIPFASFIVGLITDAKLSKSFGHKFGFTLGLWFFPFIFQLILGFGKKPYVGKALPVGKAAKTAE